MLISDSDWWSVFALGLCTAGLCLYVLVWLRVTPAGRGVSLVGPGASVSSCYLSRPHLTPRSGPKKHTTFTTGVSHTTGEPRELCLEFTWAMIYCLVCQYIFCYYVDYNVCSLNKHYSQYNLINTFLIPGCDLEQIAHNLYMCIN